MAKSKITLFLITTVYVLISSQVLYGLAWDNSLTSTLSPASNLNIQSIQHSFKTKNAIPEIADQSLYTADVEVLKRQEQLAVQNIQQFSREREKSGKPIQTLLRKNGKFNTRLGSFSFDISGWKSMIGKIDKTNFYFIAGGLIVYNLLMKNESNAFLPSPINRPAILVPMGSSQSRIENLQDQNYQLWTASLLMAMQLVGEKQFQGKDVAIAGIGNGVDTLFSLQLGAAKTYLFDDNKNLVKMFQSTRPYNTRKSTGFVSTKHSGKSFHELIKHEPVPVDVILANLPGLGLSFFSDFLQFLKPKQDSILVIISGANYSMLTDREKKTLEVLEKFKKNSEIISIDYNDGKTKIDNDPLTYIYEFDRQAWTSKEMLDAVLEAQKVKPAQPPINTVPSPINNNSVILQAI